MRPNWLYETCACCTREQRLAWHISDELWNDVVIKHYYKKVLCLECFLRMADDKGIKIRFEDIKFIDIISRYD